MSKDSAATVRTALRRRVAACGLVAGLLVASWFPDARLTTAQPAAGPRLYVFDCGYIFNLPPETYNLTREDVPDLTMSVPCFLVVHPTGTLVFDTGLGDKLVGRPPYLTRRGAMSQVVLKTLSSQMAEVGHTPDQIKYLVLSHMHFDHVGNANDFAGPATTWLVQKVERDAMFSVQVATVPINPESYAALRNARTQLLTGDHDVFGDGTVVIKATPGHTVGHQVLVVKLAKTGTVVLSGDLYHYAAERTLNRISPEREKTAGTPESRAAIEALVKQAGAQLWIGHDIGTFAKLKKSPEYYE